MALSAFLLTSASTLVVMFFPLIISILYPNQPDFQSARLAFAILMVGALFRGIVTSISPIFFSTNRPDINMPIASARVFSNIALTALLIGTYRINGAALGNAAASFVLFVFLLHLMKQKLNISTRYRPLFLIPLTGVAVLYVDYWLPHFTLYWDVIRFSLWLLTTGVIFRLGRFEVYFQRLMRSTWIGHLLTRHRSAHSETA
jgi:O-antigen/teichoic acid export membrane protein